MTFQILSWNILQGGGKRMEGICTAIEAHQPDVIVLQEFRKNRTASYLLDLLNAMGLTHQHQTPAPASANTVMIASRYPIEAKPWTDSLAIEQAVWVSIQCDDSLDIDVLAAHFPHKKKQIPYFSALLDHHLKHSEQAILIGDLNCGIPFDDSETRTFDNTHLFQALLSEGWTDSWRSRHESEREFTWISPKGNGYRYDHCLSTHAMDARIQDIRYLHEYREQGLSDHSPLLVSVK